MRNSSSFAGSGVPLGPLLVSESDPERIKIRPSGRATVVGYQRWYFMSDGSGGSVLASSRGSQCGGIVPLGSASHPDLTQVVPRQTHCSVLGSKMLTFLPPLFPPLSCRPKTYRRPSIPA